MSSAHAYHCICTSLLLATTHSLSNLPRRIEPSLDAAIILPLPPGPPSLTPDEGSAAMGADVRREMPAEGYSMLLGTVQDSKPTITRREDGFERRLILRCGRCAVPVGYEIAGVEHAGAERFVGRIVYLLPAGLVSTEVMARGGLDGNGKNWVDGDRMGIVKPGAVPAFE